MLNTCHGYDDHMYNNCMCYPNMAHKCDCLPFHKGNNNNSSSSGEANVNILFIRKTSMAIDDVVGCRTTSPFARSSHYISYM